MVVKQKDLVVYGPDYGIELPKITAGQEIINSLLYINGDDIAMEDGFTGKKLLYKTLFQRTCDLAEALRVAGFSTNTIAVSSENSLEFFIPVLAALLVGSTVAPINHIYTPTELDHVLNISKPKLVFCSRNIAGKFLEMKRRVNFIQKIIVLDDN